MIIPYQKTSLDYPLVNVYITNWKDPPCYIAGKINELSMAIFNSKLLVITKGPSWGMIWLPPHPKKNHHMPVVS